MDARGDRPLGEWGTESVDGVVFDFLPLAHLDAGDQSRKIPHSVRLASGMMKYRNMLDSSVVQSHRLEIGAVAQQLFSKRRHVQFLHIDGRDSLATGSDSYWKHLRLGYSVLEKRVLPSARDVVVFSDAGAKRLAELKAPVRFSPTWYDPANFYPSEIATPQDRVIWVGRIEPPKDPLLAVQVLAKLPAKYSLTVVGDGTLRADMARAARDFGVASRVSFAGAVDQAEVGRLMRAHGSMLMTSHYEGFPRAVVEGLASGLVVVTTQGGEPNGLVVDGVNGLRAASRDPQEIANLLERSKEIPFGGPVGSVKHLSAPSVVAAVLRPTA